MCGVDFTHYKRSTVVRRIERRMVVTHSATLSDFASLLEIDEREAKALGREFNIMAHDVGRSIQIVAHLFQDIDIVEDAEAVLRSLMPIDKEVTTVDGKNYTLRIAPYRTTENSIEGLVLTIIDSIGEK